MNERFDNLARNMARSVTRRAALKRFGLGMAGIALASLALANKADARGAERSCNNCAFPYGCDPQKPNYTACVNKCYDRCHPLP
jgi:hypothetical protein